jgi:hypothetical protein
VRRNLLLLAARQLPPDDPRTASALTSPDTLTVTGRLLVVSHPLFTVVSPESCYLGP